MPKFSISPFVRILPKLIKNMQNENVKMSLEGSIPKAILKLSVPILLANLLQSAYQLIDAFWV